MAEALFKQEVARRGEAEQWRIQSAGTWAEPDLPVTQLAQAVMLSRQIDMTGHRSKPVDGELLRAVDIILVMTRHHQEALQAEFPESAPKVYLVSQLIDRSYDIEDPYGGTLDDYTACAAELQSILTDGWPRLIELIDRSVLVQK